MSSRTTVFGAPANKRHRRARTTLGLALSLLTLGAAACGQVVPSDVGPGTSNRVVDAPSSIPHAAVCAPTMPDASTQLQAWLDSVPNHSVARLAANQCYRAEYTIIFGAKTDVTLDGNGSTLRSFTDGCDDQTPTNGVRFDTCRFPSPIDANGNPESKWPRTRSHLQIYGNINVTVTNLHIDGGKDRAGYDAQLAFQHGFGIGNNDGVRINHVWVDHVWGDYVFMSNRRDVAPKNITIEDSKFGSFSKDFWGTGRIGFVIDDGVNVHVQRNYIGHTSRSLVDIEPVSSRAQLNGIYFDNNVFGPRGMNFFSNRTYGDADPVIQNVFFRNNEVIDGGIGVWIAPADTSAIRQNDPSTFRRHNYQFINNTVSGNIPYAGDCNKPMASFKVMGVDGLVISGNYQPQAPNRCQYIVETAKVRNAVISGNRAPNATGVALRYDQSANVCESGNLVGNPLHLAPLHALATICP
jgi:hypothetical protein